MSFSKRKKIRHPSIFERLSGYIKRTVMSFEIPLSQNEKHKIFDVLDSFEKEIDVEDKINHELSAIDSQSRNCWKNWDDDILTKSRNVQYKEAIRSDKDIPFSQKVMANLMKQKQYESDSELLEEEEEYEHESNSDASNSFGDEEEQMEYEPDNESEASTLKNYLNSKTKPDYIPSRFSKTPREHTKPIKTPTHYTNSSKTQTMISRTKTPQARQSTVKKVSQRKFTKSDAAKLRQENIDLKAQLARLEAALDRTNMEKKRISELIAQSKKTRAKQQAQIDYLKEQSLYGKKK